MPYTGLAFLTRLSVIYVWNLAALAPAFLASSMRRFAICMAPLWLMPASAMMNVRLSRPIPSWGKVFCFTPLEVSFFFLLLLDCTIDCFLSNKCIFFNIQTSNGVHILLIKAKSAIDGDILSRYIPRTLGGQEEHGLRDIILTRHPAKRRFLHIIVHEYLLLVIENAPGGNCVDPYVLITEVGGKVFGHMNNASLRRAVHLGIIPARVAVDLFVGGHDTVDGADIDNDAAFSHFFRSCFCAQDGAFYIHIHDKIYLFRCPALERRKDRHPSIIDEHIKGADLVRHPGNRCLVGDIHRIIFPIGQLQFLKPCRKLLRNRWLQVRNMDMRTM